jgi:hypothetical protein
LYYCAWVVIALIVPSLLSLFAIWLAKNTDPMTEAQLKQAMLEQRTRRFQELDTAIALWLATLELPALAEETKLQEASRQLRTVLIEKLLLQRVQD